MNSTKISRAATAKAAGIAAALVLGLTLSAGGAAAHTRATGPDATPVAHEQAEQTCDKDQAAAEATLHAAAKDLQRAFVTNHLAIEQLREKAGERNNAARDLLKKADSNLKAIRSTARVALEVAGDSAEACTAIDAAAIDTLIGKATTDMEAVVTEVTAAVAALPATDVKATDPKGESENEDEDKDEASEADHETKAAEHDKQSAEKSGAKSTGKASTTSKGRSTR